MSTNAADTGVEVRVERWRGSAWVEDWPSLVDDLSRATATIERETFGPWTYAEARERQDEAAKDWALSESGSARVFWHRRYRAASAILDAIVGVERG